MVLRVTYDEKTKNKMFFNVIFKKTICFFKVLVNNFEGFDDYY